MNLLLLLQKPTVDQDVLFESIKGAAANCHTLMATLIGVTLSLFIANYVNQEEYEILGLKFSRKLLFFVLFVFYAVSSMLLYLAIGKVTILTGYCSTDAARHKVLSFLFTDPSPFNLFMFHIDQGPLITTTMPRAIFGAIYVVANVLLIRLFFKTRDHVLVGRGDLLRCLVLFAVAYAAPALGLYLHDSITVKTLQETASFSSLSANYAKHTDLSLIWSGVFLIVGIGWASMLEITTEHGLNRIRAQGAKREAEAIEE